MGQDEELIFPFSDSEIDRLHKRGYEAGRCCVIGRKNQTPLEAAEESGWKRIRTVVSQLTYQDGAVGIDKYRDAMAVMDDGKVLWAVNLTAEIEDEAESILASLR